MRLLQFLAVLRARFGWQVKAGNGPSPCRPAAPKEPILEIDEIQGNILLGFNKDFETLLFFEIADVVPFRLWLQDLAGLVTTTRDVLLFRRSLRTLRQRGAERTLRSTWLQIAFACGGLEKLVKPGEISKFRDEAFRQGLAARSEPILKDPHGSAQSWLIGGPHNTADVVVLVAADDGRDLDIEVVRLTEAATSNGARLLLSQRGARLPDRDREHFGFRDGISQPGIRGRLSEDPHDLLTPRQNPDDPNEGEGEGKPGQTLIWPGEFVFGYSGQDPDARARDRGVLKEGPNSLGDEHNPLAPQWARNGSYLVFRRLRQDVGAFRRFIRREASRLSLPTDVLEAKIIGRFRSGAPIARTPVDDPGMGADDCANNDFRFAVASPAIGPRSDDCQCERKSPPAPKDFGARTCPFAAHIRKTYPRYDVVRFDEGESRENNESHRILRHGIPFGPPYPDPEPEEGHDTAERGLLFLAYQTSIAEQFEHIQSAWANEVERRAPPPGLLFGAGHDLIIGQNPQEPRQFLLRMPDGAGGERIEILVADPFVLPTGGGYFFVPALTALQQIARGEI
jgi:Dyp-type peroxidase family